MSNNFGNGIPIKVLRNENVLNLFLIPSEWNGKGLLGCTFVSLEIQEGKTVKLSDEEQKMNEVEDQKQAGNAKNLHQPVQSLLHSKDETQLIHFSEIDAYQMQNSKSEICLSDGGHVHSPVATAVGSVNDTSTSLDVDNASSNVINSSSAPLLDRDCSLYSSEINAHGEKKMCGDRSDTENNPELNSFESNNLCHNRERSDSADSRAVISPIVHTPISSSSECSFGCQTFCVIS